jgi:hypothetical protein
MVTILDPVVIAYWESQNAAVAKFANDFHSTKHYEKSFPGYFSTKRGFLGTSATAVQQAMYIIAADHVDLGLEHAKWGKRCAETAIEVGDLGAYQNWPREFGLHHAHDNLATAKWLLGEAGSEDDLQNSLEYLLAHCHNHHFRFDPDETDDNKELDLWGNVLPFLIGGQPKRARDMFDRIYAKGPVPGSRVGKSGASFPAVLDTLLDYANGRGVTEARARETVERYYYEITGWGHHGSNRRAKLWQALVGPQHVQFAQVRAQFFTGIRDPIAIVRSIRGVP